VHHQRPLRLRRAPSLPSLPNRLDALEPRLFLSTTPGPNFDLVPTLAKSPKLSSAIITDTAVKGSVALIITNTGTDASPAATVSAFLRPTAGGSDIDIATKPAPISTIKGSTTKNGVTKDSDQSVTINVALPLTLAAGGYSLVIEVADASPAGTPAQLDNTFVAPFTLQATAGFTNLSASLTDSKIPASIVAGTSKKGAIALKLDNSGNIVTPSTFKYDITLVLRPASGADVPLIQERGVTLPSIKANGGTKTLTAPLTLSATATATITAGTYTLVALLTPTAGSTGSPLTITGPAITFTASVTTPTSGAVLKHGDTVAFNADTQLTTDPPLESGSFTTNLHVSGTYRYDGGLLTLTYSTGQQDILDIDPIGTPTFFDPTLDGNPTTVIFSFNSAGAFASINDVGAVGTPTAYAKFA
jgi:hypothetical protein